MSVRDTIPALYAARPNWKLELPAISVRSRSKNAAPFSPSRLIAPPPGGGGKMCGLSVKGDRFGSRRGTGSLSLRASLRGFLYLDDDRVTLAAAGADRRAAVAATAPAQLQHERADDAGATGSDRMAERDRAAVDVHALLVNAEHPDAVERDGRERLVDLPQVDVARLQAGLVERLAGRVGGGAGQVGEVVGHRGLGDDRREDVLAVALGPVLGGEHEGAGAVVDAGRVAGRVRPVLAGQAGQLGQRLEAGPTPRGFVDFDHRVAFTAGDGDGDDLLGEPAVVGGRERALVAAQRPLVEVRAGHLELVADRRRLFE